MLFRSGSQGGNFRGGNAKLVTQVPPQSRWHHPEGAKQTPTYAQKPNMQSHTQLVGITPARIDCLAISTSEGEKRIHLEVADIAGQLAHPQKRRLPTVTYCTENEGTPT